jgi:tetratricopeptide (TPR) repeat protein
MSTSQAELDLQRSAQLLAEAPHAASRDLRRRSEARARSLIRSLELSRWLVSHCWRRIRLVAWKAVGAMHRWIGGRRQLILGLVGLCAAVILATGVSLTHRFVVAGAVLCVGLLLARGRKSVIVEPFADHVQMDDRTVKGLSTLLIVELDRLRREINTDAEIPAAVRLDKRGGFGLGRERQQQGARFLTASADGLTHALDDAVAREAQIELGVLKLPIGAILSTANRLMSGERVIGSVHRAGSCGALVLTAQLVGGQHSRSWRIDAPRKSGTPHKDQDSLGEMVRELACQMFTDLSFPGTERWKAVDAFSQYLRLYRQSDHADTLKKAEGRLLAALAEDPNFGLASYNLGVVYTMLAHAGRTAEPTGQVVSRPHVLDQDALARAREEAARVAFWNAIETAPGLWQAHYALAATKFKTIEPVGVDERLTDHEQIAPLKQVILGCDRALDLCPPRAHESVAVIRDLRGMAEVCLGDADPLVDGFGAGIRDHSAAVAEFWKALCRAEQLECANAAAGEGRAEAARDNTAAALHHLAFAHARRAMTSERYCPSDYTASDRIFRAAIRMARSLPQGPVASSFAQGITLEHKGGDVGKRRPSKAARTFDRAAQAYGVAAAIDPTHAEYAATRARALARRRAAMLEQAHGQQTQAVSTLKSEVEEATQTALHELAPAFRNSVSSSRLAARNDECESTLAALAETYRLLDDQAAVDHVAILRDLHQELKSAAKVLAASGLDRGRRDQQLDGEITKLKELKMRWEHDATRLQQDQRRQQLNGDTNIEKSRNGWERAICPDQIDMCVARLHAAADRWPQARYLLGDVINRWDGSGRRDAERVVDFGLRAEYARALRHSRKDQDALREIARCNLSHPLGVEAHREAARIHFALGQYDEALSSWEQALGLAPNDAYAHLKAAICHRQLAICHRADHDQTEDSRRADTALAAAAAHVKSALSLFDDEDPTGAAWARVWGGRIALERRRIGESIAKLTGALDGPATTAAHLLLGEAQLMAGAVDLAKAEFGLVAAAAGAEKPNQSAAASGFELRREVLGCRAHCGLAQCLLVLAGSDLATGVDSAVEQQLKRASSYAQCLRDDAPLRRECEALVAQTRAALAESARETGDRGGGSGGHSASQPQHPRHRALRSRRERRPVR